MSTSIEPLVTQEIGAILGDFQLATLSGKTLSLQEVVTEKRGAVVVFWSSVCSHCIRYDDYLNSFIERHPDLGLVAVASRQGELLSHVKTSIATRGLTFPILLDPNSKVAKQWFTQQTPRAFFLDTNRALCYRGAIDNYRYPDDPEYVAYLEPAIKQFLIGEQISRTESASFGCAIESVYYKLPKAL